MATEATAPEESEQQEQKSGGMMKMILMGIGMFVIVLAAQTVAPLISSKLGLAPQVAMPGTEAVEGAEGEGDDEGGEVSNAPPIYWPLKPAMVVNFAGTSESSFLQVEMEVMAREQMVIDLVREHMPAIRSSLLLLLASQNDEAVFTTEGKQGLLNEALASINEVLDPYLEEDKVEAVYFTSFVAQ